MATYPTRTLRVRLPADPHMSYAVRELPEAASQTFIASAPVVITSGLVTEAADPVSDVAAIALLAGQNTTAALANPSQIVPIVQGFEFYANFLTTATGASGTVLTGDEIGISGYQVEKNTVSSVVLWHVADKADGTDAAMCTSFDSDMQLSNVVRSRAIALDVDARISFAFLDSIISHWGV